MSPAKPSRSTASEPPAGTRFRSATAMTSDPRRRISSFRRPIAVVRSALRKLFEQTSSARRSVVCASVPRTGRISKRSTATPRRASCQAASQPASPPPITVTRAVMSGERSARVMRLKPTVSASPGRDDRRKLAQGLAPAAPAVPRGFGAVEDGELIRDPHLAPAAARAKLDRHHRDRDALLAPRDRHRVADAPLGNDVDVVAILREGLVRRAEGEALAAADPEIEVVHLGRPGIVPRDVPLLEKSWVLPGAIDALGARLVGPGDDDGVMDDACLAAHRSSPFSRPRGNAPRAHRVGGSRPAGGRGPSPRPRAAGRPRADTTVRARASPRS